MASDESQQALEARLAARQAVRCLTHGEQMTLRCLLTRALPQRATARLRGEGATAGAGGAGVGLVNVRTWCVDCPH